MKFNNQYFLADRAVNTALEQYTKGETDRAAYNMALILKAYGLSDLVKPEQILENLTGSK